MRICAVTVPLLLGLLLPAWALGQIQNLQLSCIRPMQIITEDFDRDGWPDLAIACHSCDNVVVVPNLGRLGKECQSFASDSGKSWTLVIAGQGDAPLSIASGYFLDAIPPLRPLVFQDIFPHIVAVTQFTPGITRIVPLKGTPPPGAPPGSPWASWEIANGTATLAVLPGVPSPSYPAHIVLADFNKDGRPDIAVADSLTAGGGVYIYLSPAGALPPLYDAAGLVAPAALAAFSFIPLPGARYLVAADFNRDGNTDLAVATGGGVRFLCGLGDGAFDSGVPAFVVGQSVTSLAAADLDRDGDLDLVATDPVLGAVNILWNAGCWEFNVTRFKSEGAYFVHVFDCNRDGVPDLAVAQKDLDRISIFTGTITELVGAQQHVKAGQVDLCPSCVERMDRVAYTLCGVHQLPLGSRPVGLAIADYDQNGVPDLAVANNGFPTVNVSGIFPVQIIYNPCCCRICENCNAGRTRTAPCCPDGAPGPCDQPSGGTGGVDAKKRIELGTVDIRGPSEVKAGVPGRFGINLDPELSHFGVLWRFSGPTYFELLGRDVAVTFGVLGTYQVTASLRTTEGELALGTRYVTVVPAVAQPPPSLPAQERPLASSPAERPNSPPSPASTATASKPTPPLQSSPPSEPQTVLAAASGSDLRGQGGVGHWLATYSVGTPAPKVIGVGDLDGDRIADLVVASADSTALMLFRGRGDGTFDPKGELDLWFKVDRLLVANFAGTGLADILAVSFATRHAVLIVSKGPFDFADPIAIGPPCGAHDVWSWQLNEHPGYELVWRKPTGPVIWSLISFIGTNLAVVEWNDVPEFVRTASPPSSPYAWADFTGDGKPEFAYYTQNPGEVVLIMDRARVILGVTPERVQLVGLAAADANGDGRLDLIGLDPTGLVHTLRLSELRGGES